MVAESLLTSSLNRSRVNGRQPVMGAGTSMWEMPVNMRHLTLFPTCVAAVVLFTVLAVGDVVFEDSRPLHPSMLSDDLSDSEPQFATDGQGNWVAAWRQLSSLVTSFSNDIWGNLECPGARPSLHHRCAAERFFTEHRYE